MTTDESDDVGRSAPAVSTITYTTSDGVGLVGDLAVADRPIAAAIVCHPHPQYGGNRLNNVVEALFRALPAAGITALRFDFRAEYGGGVAEQNDAIASLDQLVGVAPNLPLFAVGYSFGAMVVLALDDARITGKTLVAPPLGAIELDPGGLTPTLVLTPAHDQFAPPSVAEPIVSTWPGARFETIDSVDHFIAGRTSLVAERTVGWISNELDG